MVTQPLQYLADVKVPGYTPKLPGEVDGSVTEVLSITAGIALALCVLGGLIGWAMVAIGHTSERSELAARGKQSVKWSLVAAAGVAVTGILIGVVYNIADDGGSSANGMHAPAVPGSE